MSVIDHERFMRRALLLAKRGEGVTRPNPMVGAVVVRSGQIIAKGFHRRAGTDHAEVVALKQAGRRARGATLYVTLEPCNHTGRTGPCTQAIIASGISHVVVGMRDPNPDVCGGGIEALSRAGIQMTLCVLQDDCQRLNRAFVTRVTCGRPRVTWKAALTLDGRIATRTGNAQWITQEPARREGHRLRRSHDAIVVGVETVLADDPSLTCRLLSGRDPLRVVMDSTLRTPPSARVVQVSRTSTAETWIVAGPRGTARAERQLVAAGARVIRLPEKDGHVSVLKTLQLLAAQELLSVLMEGGGKVAGSFWREQCIDEVALFFGNIILGDAEGIPCIAGPPVLRIANAANLSRRRVKQLGDDFMVRGDVVWPSRLTRPR